jgi:hypothetical protein
MKTAEDRALDYLATLTAIGRKLLEEGRSEAEGLSQGNISLVTVPRATLARLHDGLIFPPDIEETLERRIRDLEAKGDL